MSVTKLERDDRICFVGDSFIQGTCDPDCLGWTGRICQKVIRSGIAVTYYNLGVRRHTSFDILNRWQKEGEPRLIPSCEPYLVFSFGTNDTTLEGGQLRVSQEASLAHTERILRDAKALYPVIMIGPPPMLDDEQNQRTSQLNDDFAMLCNQLMVPYLSIFETLLNDPIWSNDLKNHDGSHPGRLGYQRISELVENWEGWWFFDGE